MQARATRWVLAYAIVAAAFLATCATYYHPPAGFTWFIELPANHDYDLPAIRDIPHNGRQLSDGYDGQFYAQLAVEPLLSDPAIDRALDLPPYRARRILFSWTAYLLGLGHPAWILQVYALQNIAVWLVLAWLLCRWIPPVSARAFALWAGCMLTYGALASVRLALVDLPSMLLIALGVVAMEKNRPVVAAAITGVAGLARETNLLVAAMFTRLLRRDPRSWLIVAGCLLLCVLPLALWTDYLRSIYRSTVLAGGDHISTPLSGLAWKWKSIRFEVRWHGLTRAAFVDICSLAAFVAQGAWVLWALIVRRDRSPWALIAVTYLGLTLITHVVVWEGSPGSYTRATAIPLTFGAAILLARLPNAPWWLIGLFGLGAIPGVLLLTPQM